MNFSQLIRRTACQAEDAPDLSEEEAHDLFSAVLDGGVADLELAALLTALSIKGETASELLGCQRAVCERLYPLIPPLARPKPLVIPTYGGTRAEHNLLPLLGLLLRRLGIPILFHGTLHSHAPVASAYILRELGVMPSPTRAQAQGALDDELLAFVPVAVVCPGLANLLALRNRLGIRNTGHAVVQLLDPFHGHGVRLASAETPRELHNLALALSASGDGDLLLKSTEGEAFADPRRRPRIEWLAQGERRILFDEEPAPAKPLAGLPSTVDVASTAAWIRLALEGATPIPHPLVNELACCLYATGYTDDMNQAKAIAAVETGSLAPVGRRRTRRAIPSRPVSR
jgi:anthranilate phosphoribosyltransferase